VLPRVLYIEDNRDNLILVRRVLKAAGFELLEATNARDGIELAQRAQPDLILIDINMPEMDGLTATTHLRQIPELEHVPVIALTANVMRSVLDRAAEAGCDGHIAKPIKIDEFPEQIMRYLRNGRH
jgi:two-component system cell cycle response regulator DivK